jgi:SAM-dependent methyltransferase
MADDFSYHHYVKDEPFHEKYIKYQRRYREQIRESDKVILEMIGELLAGPLQGRKVSCLDIGCSTGNLLFHLRRAFPDMELTGGDFAESQVDSCRADKSLAGIRFEVMDMLNSGSQERFDIIISNAVLYMFSDRQYHLAVKSVSKTLSDDGWFLSFDFAHSYEQDIKIIEKSQSHPKGLDIHFRPYSKIRKVFEKSNFANIEFRPFRIPIDLARGAVYSEGESGFEDLNSYTVKTETGDRLLFRGALYQPWCHMIAHKGISSGGGR